MELPIAKKYLIPNFQYKNTRSPTRIYIVHVHTYLQFINADCNKQTDSQTGKIEDPLSQHKSHREEEIGGRKERQDEERKGKQRQLFFSRLVFGVMVLFELQSSSLFSTAFGH